MKVAPKKSLSSFVHLAKASLAFSSTPCQAISKNETKILGIIREENPNPQKVR
ncbi:MAG: hypothetical protein HC847_23980 [Hydrococcus sp. RU_2_2]|jgi:hypothetical protein|nr:hypothetical protein [Hydrococcus sp. RU_2_2]NJP18051.1 hypothetical protein [Hydrococcus sp. CRU_1_1]NJQ96997.1 hypothetical protein [Hydrococcus sp. CSU_1_8]